MRINISAITMLLAVAGMWGCGASKSDKAASSEARQFVKQIYSAARIYYMDQAGIRRMVIKAPQFPGPSVGPTPPLGSCCKSKSKKCAPDPALWNHPVWTALKFSIAKPHYYSYSYIVAKDGKSYTARANGDLDCDGKYSTFEMTGVIDAAYGDGPSGSGTLFRNETD